MVKRHAETDAGIEPRKRPVATQREVARLTRHYAALMGFGHPYRINVGFHDCRKGDYCDDTDKNCYACAEVQPQYHRVNLHFDLYHPAWNQKEPDVGECVRHELGHGLVGMYTQQATHLIGDDNKPLQQIFEDLEDSLVQRIAAMPIWKHAPDA